MPASIATECPSRELLVEYASGTLAEVAAETLSVHLEGCEACQRRVDELMGRADSLMGVLRNTPVPPTRVESNADHLIAQAKLLAPVRPGGTSSNGHGETARRVESQPRPAINANIAAFLATLTRSRLMSREEVDNLADANLPSDAKEFARELVAAKKLTNFQASALLRGISRGLVLGNYVILDKLRRAGMGHVYKARQQTMGRIVCIKTLPSSATQNPEMLERFRREARAVAALNHPNIVVGHDAAESDGIHYLVMEYIEGSDLAKRAKEKAFTINEAVAITLQTAKALAYAHRQGIVHRDIKPHNLLLDDTGNVKILDMGIARFDAILGDTCDASGQATMTNTGVVMGTVDFMSPEQALNTRKADARSDVYSLGCTLYYILTQKPLFGGDTVMEKLVAHRETPPPKLSDSLRNVPPGLEAVFRKMVAKEPRDRYATMDDLAADLSAVQAGQKPKAQSGRFVAGVKSHWKVVSAATAVVAVLAIVLSGVLNQPGQETDALSVAGADDSRPADGDSPDAASPSRTARPIVGDPHTVMNGGAGRFLLMVPHDEYQATNLNAVQGELTTRGAEVVVLSSQAGSATPANGRGNLPVDITLDEFEFDVHDFDGIIVAGGNVEQEFGNKNSAAQSRVRDILNECLSEVRVLAFLDNAHQLMFDGTLNKEDFTIASCASSGCGIGVSNRRSGCIIKLEQPDHVRQMVDLMYRQFEQRYKLAEGGPGRALLVVSNSGYNAESFRQMAYALRRAGIEFDVAAEQPGRLPSGRDGSRLPRGAEPVLIDISLHDVTPNDYDAVIFCDGSRFGSQVNPEQCKQFTQGLVAGLMNRHSVAAGIGSGWSQLQGDFGGTSNCEPDSSHAPFDVFDPKDGREGHAVGAESIATAAEAEEFVKLIFEELLRS